MSTAFRLSAVVLGALALCTSASVAQAAKGVGGLSLLSLSAEETTLVPSGGEGMRLVLGSPGPNVDLVPARGKRSVPLRPPADLARKWGRYGFKRNPPLAAIRDIGASSDRDVILVRLSAPRVLRGGAISYRAVPAGDAKVRGPLRTYASEADESLDPELGAANVLIGSQTQTVTARIDWSLPAGWGATFNTQYGPARVTDLNPFTGTAGFGQDLARPYQFGLFSDTVTTGYMLFTTVSQNGCIQVGLDANQPFTSLYLSLGDNVGQTPMQVGVTEVCDAAGGPGR